MEVGCCTFRGAGDYGGAGWHVAMEPDGLTPKPGLVRDEGEQVRYLDDLMPIFEDEGVDSVFWFSFAGYGTPHRLKGPDPDLASYGIVKILDEQSGYPADERAYPDLPWEPKQAFRALANRYKALKEQGTSDRRSR
jgi:hypothetical protein